MKKDKLQTVVLFLEEINPYNILAVFPKEIEAENKVACYSSIGQHSNCDIEYYRKLKRASRMQYLSLWQELEREHGYNLYVLNGKNLINQVITPVNTQYGAPMGRPNVGTSPKNPRKKVYDLPVPFIDGVYDTGGAYWGSPANLRVKCTRDLQYVEFYRRGK